LNLRFIYGKLFRSIMKHLESNFDIDSFLRYILNYTDNNKPIKDGYIAIIRNVNDWINQHEIYNQNSLDSISTYITSLFKNNDKTLEDHYYRMKIVQQVSRWPIPQNKQNYRVFICMNVKIIQWKNL